ncbi:hypothetical protein AMR72_16200 [Flavobacterium psychrophilum]|nr:hypothetical protein AMR72_16200 [Flavobacterium psychrophilum]AOE53908.1 hypothetical protein ALW18_16190 [Flavobacterium psychrophilum]
MKPIYLFALVIFTLVSCEKKKDTWTTFYDKDQYLIGFKDAKGKEKISPKFMGATNAKKFDDVVAVMEENNKKWDSYYLLKNGRQFGRDSLYVNDATFDCESEGFIRYTSKDKVGMFNSEGKPVIPADYNSLTRFKNGIAFGVKGAVKEKDKTNYEGSPGWYWTGGKGYIINIKNEILAENVTYNPDLDYYSLEITNEPAEESYRTNFKSLNGKYYSFINNKALFEHFLKNDVLNKISQSTLNKVAYSKIIYWDENKGWLHQPSAEFIREHYSAIAQCLKQIKPGSDYMIMANSFAPVPDDIEKEFDKYRDNCGNINTTKYPLMSVIINHKKDNDLVQDSFDFIKTDDGYKLLSVNIKSIPNL